MNKAMVKIITIISSLIGLFFLFCLVWAIQDYYGEKHSTTEKPRGETRKVMKEGYSVVAIGDSLTRGTGDETGKGYVGLVEEDLEKRLGEKPIIHNLGIKGQVSEDLLGQVRQKEVKRQLKEADVIMLTIGGNDLFQQGDTLLEFNEESLQKVTNRYLQNLDSILGEIEMANDHATTLMVGLYNPFIELDDDYDTNRIVREWNQATEEVVARYAKAVFVPTFDLFQLSVHDYLYSDNFHPNKEGYRLISDRVAPLIQLEGEEK